MSRSATPELAPAMDGADETHEATDPVLEAVARAICFAWGHCAGGCRFQGVQCEGDAGSLLADWQGRSARAAIDILGAPLSSADVNARFLSKAP